MKKSTVDLSALQVLLSIVSAGGFAQAARLLGVPPNRLSRQIQRLEAELGVRLLHRTTRRLNLTTAGRTLLDEVTPALAQIESAWSSVGMQAEEVAGHFKITAPADFLAVFKAERLAAFLEAHPAVSIELILGDDVSDILAQGIDLALRGGAVKDESLIAQPIDEARFIPVASPGLLSQLGLPKSARDLSFYPCVLAHGKEGRAIWTMQGPDGEESVAVSGRLMLNSSGALIIAAKAGLGIALVPNVLVKYSLADGSLIHLLPDYFFRPGCLYAVYSSRNQLPKALRVFINFVIGELRPKPPAAD